MLLGNDWEDYDSGTYRSALQQQQSMPAIGWNLMQERWTCMFSMLPQDYYFALEDQPIPADDFICAYCAGGEL